MNKQEQKTYIKQHWNTSSGKKIAEMLKRYWLAKPRVDNFGEKKIFEVAKELFSD